MNGKYIRSGLATLALAALFGGGMMISEAEAGPGWHGRHRYENLNPQMQTKYDAAMRDYHEKMSPLTEKMMGKRLELNALSGNPNADPKHISTLAAEIAALQTQIRQERRSLDERLQSEVGLDMRYGPGGRGWHDGRAYGCGEGPGFRDGRGPGSDYGHRGGPGYGPGYGHRGGPGYGHQGGGWCGQWNTPDAGSSSPRNF